MDRDDEKWVRKAQQGSKKDFDKLVGKYVPLIFRLLYDITHNREDAEDLTQEVFLRTYLNIRQYRGDAQFSTWLYKIAYNIGVDFKRQEKKDARIKWEHSDRKMALNKFDTSENEYTGEREAIETALKGLTQPQSIAVVLHYYHGFQMREIGEIIGCSEATVRVHLFRALEKLRMKLTDHSPEV